MKFRIHIDKTANTEKPSGSKIGAIRNRLDYNHSQTSLTEVSPEELENFIERGYTFQPCVVYSDNDDGEKYKFVSQQVFFFDIDNADHKTHERLSDAEYYSIERIGEVLQENGLAAALIYRSFSWKPDFERYRIVFLLDEPVKDMQVREKIFKAVFKLFGRAIDTACQDLPRMFFGSSLNSVEHMEECACSKADFLSLYDRLHSQESDSAQDCPEMPSNLSHVAVPSYSGGLDKTLSPDFDPDILLEMIDPNSLTYPEWLTVSASYKYYETGTQSLDYWLNWCKGYENDKARADKNTWNSLNGRDITKGSLLYFAKQHNPLAYDSYVKEMNQHSRKCTVPDTSLRIGNSSTQADSNKSNTSELPYFIYYVEPTKKNPNGYYVVSARYLANYVRETENYFFVADNAFDGVRCFWYDKQKGVYTLVSDLFVKSLLKSYIEPWEKILGQSLMKTKDINEAYTLLTWDNERTKPESVLDGDEMTINFKNGLYNLKTGKLSAHTPENYSTIQLDANYISVHDNPDIENQLVEKCPVFMNYLNTLTNGDPEKMQLLLEYMGGCLSNIHGYRFKKALFLIGEGNTGKSQYIKLIAALLGEKNVFACHFPELDDRFQSGATYRKRLVFDADMKIMRAKSNHNFMTYTGGDPRQVEFKGMNPFTAIYTGFLLFAANELPKWGGNTTEAAYNRMLVLYCNNIIPENDQDPNLLNKMLAEREHIIALALYEFMGALQRRYKFTIPPECATALIDLKKNNSPAVDFYTSCCERLPDAETNIKHCYKCSDMYRVFQEWCAKYSHNGYTPSAREFRKDIFQFLKSDEKQMTKKYNGTFYYKFTLTQEAENEF